MLIRVLVVIGATVAFVGCASSASSGAGSSAEQARGSCTADATKVLVRAFVRGYDNGELRRINRMWAKEPRFQWFSAGPPGARLGERAYDRTTLTSYFRSRAQAQERIRLTKLNAAYDPARGIVNFNGKLVRSAKGTRPQGPKDFKGAADCLSGRPILIVWSM